MSQPVRINISVDETREKCLATSTRSSYARGIKIVTELMTDSQRDEYVGSNGFLVKAITFNVFAELLDKSKFKCRNNQEMLKTRSAIDSLVSAIKFWHGESDRHRPPSSAPIEITAGTKRGLKEYLKGYNMHRAEVLAQGETRVVAGKRPLSFAGYKVLAKNALLNPKSSKQSLLCHSYLTIAWNLMARSSEVLGLLWNNVGWEIDSLTFTYEKSKTNQEGLNIAPRYVYANPDDPKICPVLALGLKLVCETFDEKRTFKLFDSETANNSFGEWMRNTLRSLDRFDRALIDVAPERIGSHSLRKGAATYASGHTGGPCSDGIKLRMQHTLGGTDDLYIFGGAGADQYIGRVVAGLDHNTIDFGALPPHFKPDFRAAFDEILPATFFDRACNSLISAVPFLVASVVYHAEWLELNLPKIHPFFSSSIFVKGHHRNWRPQVMTGCFVNKQTGLRSSGLPSFVNILAGQIDLGENVANMGDKIVTRIESSQKEFLATVSSSNGIQIHNEETISRVLRSFGIDQMGQKSVIDIAAAVVVEDLGTRRYRWGGKLHPFPESFRFPLIDTAKLWGLWVFGNGNDIDTPYHMFVGNALSNPDRILLSKARFLMDTVRAEIGLTYDEIYELGRNRADTLFDSAFKTLLGAVKGHKKMNFGNAYKHLKFLLNQTKPASKPKPSRKSPGTKNK